MVLTRHVSKRLCRKVHRNVVDTWLNLDRDQRVRPDYGTVIILLLAAEDTDAEFDKKRKATSSETNRA